MHLKNRFLASLALPIVVTSAIIGLFLLLGGCGEKASSASTPATNTEDESIPVHTAPVQQKSIALPIHTSGILTTTAEQRLSFKIGGVIRKIRS